MGNFETEHDPNDELHTDNIIRPLRSTAQIVTREEELTRTCWSMWRWVRQRAYGDRVRICNTNQIQINNN